MGEGERERERGRERELDAECLVGLRRLHPLHSKQKQLLRDKESEYTVRERQR